MLRGRILLFATALFITAAGLGIDWSLHFLLFPKDNKADSS